MSEKKIEKLAAHPDDYRSNVDRQVRLFEISKINYSLILRYNDVVTFSTLIYFVRPSIEFFGKDKRVRRQRCSHDELRRTLSDSH